MNFPDEEPLLAFGQWLMSAVRDYSIACMDKILKGQMLDTEPNRLDNALSTLGEKEQRIVLALVPKVVDMTLHYLLASLDDDAPNIAVAVTTPVGNVSSINEVSDGLAGELYGKDGWIARFSKQRLGIAPPNMPSEPSSSAVS